MSDIFDKLVRNGCIAVGLAGVAYAIFVHGKMNKMCEKIDRTVKEVEKGTDIDISDALIEQAVNRVVEVEVKKAVEKITDEITKSAKNDISSAVQIEVDKQKKEICESVKNQVTVKVANLDISELREDVVEKAKDQVAKKFDEQLDGVLDDFNQNLKNVGTIYESIAGMMKRDDSRDGKEMIFKLA